MQLKPPVTYQGGKQRLAERIIDLWNPNPDAPYVELCCGSAAVTLELLTRGISPQQCTVVDNGPWGDVWTKIGAGTFDMDFFERLLDDIPADREHIQRWMQNMAAQPVPTVHLGETYLALQAGSFGGKAIWVDKDKWQNASFRNYWQPTETSSRRSPVNPMMPMPEQLKARVHKLIEKAYGITGIHGTVQKVSPHQANMYIDPPYRSTTRYFTEFDVVQTANCWLHENANVAISEKEPLHINAYLLDKGRTKGGISGTRTTPNAEWLSIAHQNDNQFFWS